MVKYTNRKGVIYYLHQGITKTGKPRYYFSPKNTGDLVFEIPDDFEIRESVNGRVSLVRVRPKEIKKSEVALIMALIENHPDAANYRLDVKPRELLIYERVGPDMEAISSLFTSFGFPAKVAKERLDGILDEVSRFSPLLRFTLEDKARRIFRLERMSFLGSKDEWAYVDTDALETLAERMIPRRGSETLFEFDYDD